MYFPYLFDKRSELLVLRGLAGSLGTPQKIVPVIEPVTDASGLKRLHSEFERTGDFAYVIVNPNLLILGDPAERARWDTETAALFDGATFLPTLKVDSSTTATELTDFAAAWSGQRIGLVIATSKIAAGQISAAVSSLDCLAFMTEAADRSGLIAVLGAGRTVEVNDRFEVADRNADYSGTDWFSRDHLDFAGNGHPGFSDYTVLAAAPQKGGGPAGAVVIHITVSDANGLWVQHFLSDERDRDLGNASSKLLEAATHLASEVTAAPSRFVMSSGLRAYLDLHARGGNSNLAKNKEWQVSHHLEVVAHLLGI